VESKTNRNPGSGVRSPLVLLRQGEALMRLGRYTEASVVARQVLAEDPHQLGALELAAKALWQAGAYEEVLSVIRRLVVLNPYEPGYHALQGASLQCLGRYGEAARAFARSSEIPSSRQALDEIRSWQAELLAGMIQSDPVFRAQYNRDPKEACTSRGFDFAEEARPVEWWIAERQPRVSLFTRPS